MGTPRRKFARGTARIAPLATRPPRPLATTCRESAVLRSLEEHAELVSESWDPDARGVLSLLRAAFARDLDAEERRLVEQLGPSVQAAADAIWCLWCHADDTPRMCGVEDDRFTFYITSDPAPPCPLTGCCKTRWDALR